MRSLSTSLPFKRSATPDFATMRAPADAVRVTFYQLAIMLRSGVNILDALETLKRSASEHPSLELALGQVVKDIQSGHTFSKSLTRFPRLFPRMLVELTRAGEETGRLAEVLTQATDWLSKQSELKRKLIGALSYPMAVAGVAAVVNLLVLNFSLPQMEEMLSSLDVETPLLTKIVFGFGHLVANPITLCIVAVLLAVGWKVRYQIATERRMLLWFKTVHQIPVVGKLVKSTALARIASTLHICIDVNLNLLKAMHLSLSACGNPAYTAVLPNILNSIRDGESLATAFSYYPDLFPTSFCQSFEVGEESGQLPTSLISLGQLLEVEVDMRVKTLSTLVEPVLLGCCAVFVGVFVLATILPLQDFLAKLMT